jgi:hypothetical protein
LILAAVFGVGGIAWLAALRMPYVISGTMKISTPPPASGQTTDGETT